MKDAWVNSIDMARLIAVVGLSALLAACSGDNGSGRLASGSSPNHGALVTPTAGISGLASATATGPIQNPILFVAQVPTEGDPFNSRMSTFANHIPDIESVPRGGDLMIRYPDGKLRNLTKEAGFGMPGLQLDKAIAVREPSVHWDGTKAVFSMLIGAAPEQHIRPDSKWQLYEVTGLAQGQTAVIKKVSNQPAGYNNVSPFYASDDRILFASDRPLGGQAHLYPHLDEYESTPTLSGLYSLNPASGELKPLNHTPSGAFSPTIDSFGRVIFTRWDHLQRDQQAEDESRGPRNFTSEAPNAQKLTDHTETFPESRMDGGMSSPYGQVNQYTNNLFTPWQMNQDGTDELTLNHIGRQELTFNGFVPRSFASDSSLRDNPSSNLFANKKEIRIDGGIFHLRENPKEPGIYYGIYAREFGEGTTNQIVRITGAPSLNAEQMTVTDASPAQTQSIRIDGVDIGILPGGRFRNPLPMVSGHMVAAYTPSERMMPGIQLRLHQLNTEGAMFVAGNALTPGIFKKLSWWSPDELIEFDGQLWEIEPVEVVARTRPTAPSSTLAPSSPEKRVLQEELVDEAVLRKWMKDNKLALIVTRNQTSRDQGDRQQPFNLQVVTPNGVPNGVKTIGNGGVVYGISHYQIFQGNQVRSYDNFNEGRRTIAQPMNHAKNPPNAGGPAGSVRIANDGSTAAFVPANRALTWQTTDGGGTPIVRERVWVTMQPGEIRVCTGCHGSNSKNQAGLGEPLNEPEALRKLLSHWKQSSAPIRVNGAQPLIRSGQ